MTAFHDEYLAMLRDTVVCPKCHHDNKAGASETIEVDQAGSMAFCNNCGCYRRIEAFTEKEPS